METLSEELVHRGLSGAPHTIYQELWHLAFWQQITLDWIAGVETAYPKKTSDPFPTADQAAGEPWPELCHRFLDAARQAARIALQPAELTRSIRYLSRPGQPVRVISVQDRLLSLAAHSAYHLGRIVLLRQLLGVWPPHSGGFTW